MYFILLAVVLLFGTSCVEANDTDCEIKEASDDYVIRCVKGTEVYGRLEYMYGDLKHNYDDYYDNSGAGTPDKHTMTIEWIGVEDAYKKKKVASALLQYFIDEVAKKNHVHTIELYIKNKSTNPAAVGLYRKFGFADIPSRPNGMVKHL